MRTIFPTVVLAVAIGLSTGVAGAQQAVVAGPTDQIENQSSRTVERIGGGSDHYIRRGDVQIDLGDTQIYADEVEFFTDQNRATATGNVVVSQANSRIAADRADFDLKTKLGTFYNAWGMAPVGPQKARPGAAPGLGAPMAGGLLGAPGPALSTQTLGADTDVYFFGETIEKTGPKKYKITNGGFTTCVQPTPRWELHSSTVILNLDHYTVLRNAVFRVKGVPLLYTPFMYYPTKRDDRATGILLPTYGATSLRGQAIHNAFFWAVDRSQDATALYDWYSSGGQGVGSEYRYNFGPGSNGNFKNYWLDQKATTDASGAGLDANRSYELRGSANQALTHGFRARANVNYFSSITSMQTLNTNVYDASRNSRTFGGNVVGVVNNFSVNGTFDRTETFYGTSNSATNGSWPRVTVSRNERPLFGSAAYFSFTGDYSSLLRNNRDGDITTDLSLSRFEVMPQIRYPFTKWQWFTINSTVSWRDTYFSRSRALGTSDIVDEGLNRQFFEFQARLMGPVISRVWNTPDNGYAEKFKHSVEPFLTIGRTTSINEFDRIIQLDAGDSIVGGATRYTYGVTNRFYAKQRRAGSATGQAREIASVDVTQSYYSDERSAQYDRTYATSFLGAPPSHYSPISINARSAPTDLFSVSLRAEIDSQYLELRTISANGTYSGRRITATGVWSKRAFIEGLDTFNDPTRLDQYITASGSTHTLDNSVGASYSVNYDVLNSRLLQQRFTGFYNSQCCGLAFEYQVYNFGSLTAGLLNGLTQDHRFFMSFTLAGLGNFSPFSGALSGAPR
ncbi:MAG: putative LPS assembly protein LptD [Acidobacteriota bacterium]